VGNRTYGTVLARIGCAFKTMSRQKFAKTTKRKIWFNGEDKITVCILYEN
jgi:hypothetical protein